MKQILSFLTYALSITVALLLGALSLQYFEQRDIRDHLRNRLGVDEVHQSRIQQDLLILKNFGQGEAQDIEVYGAAIRLARLRDPAAFKFALDHLTHPSMQVRLAVAESLGHFSDSEATVALTKMFDAEVEPEVRQRLIKALAKVSLPERQKKLDEILADSLQPDSHEHFLAHLGKMLSSEQTEVRADSLQWIQQRALDPASPLYAEAVKTLLTHRRDDPFTQDVLRQAVTQQSHSQVTAIGIRFLSTQNDSWMEEQLPRLIRSPSAQVRMAAVQSLHRSCPPSLGLLFREILSKESDPRILDLAYRGLTLLPGPSTRAFIFRLIQEDSLSGQSKERLEQILNTLSDNDRRNPCRDRSLEE